MTKRYSGMEAEHKAWAQQRENHAGACRPRKEISDRPRAPPEEILSLRAKVSQHLSLGCTTTELEALGIRLKEAEADAAGRTSYG